MSTKETDALAIMRAVAEAQAHEDIWWRTDGEYAPITFFVNCNDIFAWACSDCEELSVDNLPVFVQSCKDDRTFGTWLFVARVRGERPQGACYKSFTPAQAKLFDAAGPAREVCLLNPSQNVAGQSESLACEEPER